MINRLISFIAIFIIMYINLNGQQAFMVKDISPITLSSEPEFLVKNGNYIYFYANDSIHGNELWRTDGTSSETVLVKDINPGKGNCYDENWYNDSKPISINNILYFVADDGETGSEVWRTDGTTQGTYQVVDVGTNLSDKPMFLTSFNGMLYFYANDGLWKSDGTTGGTEKIKDVVASNLIVANNSLFFTSSNNSSHIAKLWKTDGTETGTVIVKEYSGYSVFSSGKFIAYNNKLYFSAGDFNGSKKLWTSDGTTAGTIPVKDNTDGFLIYPYELAISNNSLFISAMDSLSQKALWISNGTTSGTEKIYSFKTNYSNSALGLIDINGILFFQAKDSTVGNYNNEDNYLWKSDGTTEGTEVITSLLPVFYFGTSYLTCFDNNLYMRAYDSLVGYELWRSDGTEDGTHIVKNICPDNCDALPGYLATLNDKLLFAANDREHGSELWISDGTEEGTALVRDINTFGDSYINELTKVGETLFFSARTTGDGQKLWTSDGTNTGTNMVITPEEFNLNTPKYITEFNGAAYFYMDNNGMYKSDGTEAGTMFIKPLLGKNMAYVDNYLYGDSRPGFWKSDGTAAGSNNITNDVWFDKIISVDSLLYLHNSNELYKSDGTESGTEWLMSYKFSDGITSINNKVYFPAAEWDSSYSILTTDGTTQGAERVKEMRSSNLTAVGNTLFCSGADNLSHPDFELWKSDGTNTGTFLVKNINLSGNSNPKCLTDINGTLYFIADDGVHGLELWKSNGTEYGTIMIKDINPGPENSFSSNSDSTTVFVAIDTLVFFTADNGIDGYELWKTDGTEAGTTIVEDLNNAGSSYPKYLTNVGGTLFYTAYEEVHGRELWAYGIPDISCLAEGISFLTQSDVDNFQINYPGCERVEGEVFIGGDDITSLSSLFVLTSFGDNLIVGNTTGLSDLTGLNNTVTIGGSLIIGDSNYGGNSTLTSLSGLNNLSSIQGDLIIRNNDVLTTLDGINNLNSVSITNLFITDNPLLSTCGINPVCEYLSNQNGTVDIQNNSPGCNNENEVNYYCMVQLSEQTSTSPATVYPNPATNEISIISYNGLTIDEMSIYNMHGQKVVFKHNITDKIDTSALGQGIYIIELLSNGKRYREKLIIK